MYVKVISAISNQVLQGNSLMRTHMYDTSVITNLLIAQVVAYM